MSARIFDGTAFGRRIREEVAGRVADLVAAGHRPPGLGVVLAGDDPASAVYVRMKTQACAEAGIHSVQIDLPQDVEAAGVLAAVAELNRDDRIDGILVQLPLPPQVDSMAVIESIDPRKDVDGVHPQSAGRLAQGRPTWVSCTPAGIMRILADAGVELRGAEAVVVGRSNIVGRPMALLLLNADATVTMAHSRTRDLAATTRRADVLIVAAGRPGLITADMVKPGAVVIDVGVNRTPSSIPGGRDRIVGDVDRAGVEAVAGLLTPVPGGVGPLTIAMLLANTVEAARRNLGIT
jgi:methylenetetrahydrofolate dehydrogenase (NADP+)/methenyltetrahydrofolate cyclohydrolase